MISMNTTPVVYFNLFLIICFITVCLQGLKLIGSVIFRCAVNKVINVVCLWEVPFLFCSAFCNECVFVVIVSFCCCCF